MKKRLERKIKVKAKKITNSFKYAFEGFKTSFKEEKNMKFHILIMLITIIFGIFFSISKTEWIICVILFGLVISSELFNTAIENLVDLVTKEKHPLAKTVKDVSAAAVLTNAIVSVIIGLIIFLPKLEEYIK